MNSVTEAKTCTSCKLDLPLDCFGFRSVALGKLQSWCRSCRQTHQSAIRKSPTGTVWFLPCSFCGDVYKHVRKRGDRNGNTYCSKQCASRAHTVKAKFGLTPTAFRDLWERQAGICAMPGCFKILGLFGATGCHVDHDHLTGQVRGILCHRCNVGLGWYERLAAVGADLYLQRSDDLSTLSI